MCDTFVALGPLTLSGETLFAKNSDRDANEAQVLEHVPSRDWGRDWGEDKQVRLTYIEIPEAPHTFEVLLSRPYWMWGAEMGANEWGVVIGNEAVMSKVPPGREPGLIGMDMVRLGLERGQSARDALKVICDLVETYGQSGNCGHPQAGNFYYHNSFLIADRSEAFVLETIGKDWIYEKVSGLRSISNTLTIGENFDDMSSGLKTLAESVGWKPSRSPFNFRRIFGHKVLSELASGPKRWRQSSKCLEEKSGALTPADMMAILRDRGPRAKRDPKWRPDGMMNGTICAHASFGPIRRFGQTVASQVSSLSAAGDLHFMTGTSAPDTGLFKPLTLDAASTLSQLEHKPAGTYDSKSLWWRHERLHRAVLEDYAARLPAYEKERDRLEKDLTDRATALRGDTTLLGDHIKGSWDLGDQRLEDWLRKVRQIPARDGGSAPYRHHWRRLAQKARMV